LTNTFFNIENEFLKENENLQIITDEIRGFLNPIQFAKFCLVTEKQKNLLAEVNWREYNQNNILIVKILNFKF
jgi:hypothetical protein